MKELAWSPWKSSGLAGAILLFLLLAFGHEADAADRWVGAWGYAPASADIARDAPLPPGTYRYRVRATQGGSAVQLTFSNAEGAEAVRIADASIAHARDADGLEADAATRRALRFSHKAGVELPVGRSVLTDPLPFHAVAGKDMIVTVSFASPTRPARTNLGMPMDFAAAQGGPAVPEPLRVRPYLTLVAVKHDAPGCTIVAFGDSITDGFDARSPVTRGWPGRLAERIAARPGNRRCSVVNMGISGNRLLRHGRGVAGVDRFLRDVASVPNVSHVILLEGINDINGGDEADDPETVSDALLSGYRAFVNRAHALGIKVAGGTITPAGGARRTTPARERMREMVNDHIRNGGIFDAVVDFDAAVRDPVAPARLLPGYDTGDHLHPNDAGYRAMGDAVNLALFRSSP